MKTLTGEKLPIIGIGDTTFVCVRVLDPEYLNSYDDDDNANIILVRANTVEEAKETIKKYVDEFEESTEDMFIIKWTL